MNNIEPLIDLLYILPLLLLFFTLAYISNSLKRGEDEIKAEFCEKYFGPFISDIIKNPEEVSNLQTLISNTQRNSSRCIITESPHEISHRNQLKHVTFNEHIEVNSFKIKA